MELYIGIDPGLSGGLTCIDQTGRVLAICPMPPTNKDLLHIVTTWAEWAADPVWPLHAMLEQAQPFPKQGVVSVATYMKNFGAIEMALVAAGIRYDTISPIKWMNALHCRTHGNKNITKARAQGLFPDVPVTHAIADALLIAEYGRRLHRGMFAASTRGTDDKAHARTETGKGQAASQASGTAFAGGAYEQEIKAGRSRPALADAPRHGTRPGRQPRSTL